MGMIDRIRARRAEGRGLLAFVDRIGGWRALVRPALGITAAVRRARHGQSDPLARGADAVGDAIGQVDDDGPGAGTE